MKNNFNCQLLQIHYMPQLPRAVTEFKKMFEQYGYYPKFLHWSKVKMSPQSKFFNQVFLFKSNFKVFTLYPKCILKGKITKGSTFKSDKSNKRQ